MIIVGLVVVFMTIVTWWPFVCHGNDFFSDDDEGSVTDFCQLRSSNFYSTEFGLINFFEKVNVTKRKKFWKAPFVEGSILSVLSFISNRKVSRRLGLKLLYIRFEWESLGCTVCTNKCVYEKIWRTRLFLGVQDSSIGDIVSQSLSHSVTQSSFDFRA